MNGEDLSQFSMLDLFKLELESQGSVLTTSLLALERDPTAPSELEACMRAAHSLKGGARIVGLNVGVGIAHVMEDCFVAAQHGKLTLDREQIDLLLGGVDLLTRIASTPEAAMAEWEHEKAAEVSAFVEAVKRVVEGGEVTAGGPPPLERSGEPPLSAPSPAARASEPPRPNQPSRPSELPRASQRPGTSPRARGSQRPEALVAGGRVVRVTADSLNRLLALAGESLVESRWLRPFDQALLRLKRTQREAGKRLDLARQAVSEVGPNERALAAIAAVEQKLGECEQLLSPRLVELELFDNRTSDLARRLYEEAQTCRMRPFSDGTQGFPRMVRDVARTLGKEVRLEISGHATMVDRDILEQLDAPLGHLLRNAVDHGLEAPAERLAAGKPAEGLIRLDAHHSAGTLKIQISDDGRGVDPAKLRRVVVERGLTTAAVAEHLSEAELFEFLFLPGFTLKETVSDISGRGVGLDAVQASVRQVRGTVRVTSELGRGARFQLQLPLTLSVVRTLLARIGGEPYAFPLAHVVRTLKLPRRALELLEGRQNFDFDGVRVGVVSASQVLGGESGIPAEELAIVVIGGHEGLYGLVVDGFLGERELVVQPLDPRLGKLKDIAAGALMEDGSPVLIVDVEDLIRSVEKLVSGGALTRVQDAASADQTQRKRILVVDDSLTVRELERKLLGNRGYAVDIAVDGMDGWNAVRTESFQLVITDIDMPRMDGFELVSLIKKDPHLKSLPVMIVSYKDREEDRRRGLEVGADYYLTKGSFHDDTLLGAVSDLIGEPVA
jgi:two-component system, chemotaxis family, sensor histidine kinase and response regulator WspE